MTGRYNKINAFTQSGIIINAPRLTSDPKFVENVMPLTNHALLAILTDSRALGQSRLCVENLQLKFFSR